MEKLELKHLAPYLPYGLKMFYTSLDGRDPRQWTLRDGTLIEALINQNKPILRPLSDLTKEIEVNGEKFVPNERLKGLGLPMYESGWGWSYDSAAFLCIKSIKTYKLLTEWHFDIEEFHSDGLIEKGLAIDINTLQDGTTNNP